MRRRPSFSLYLALRICSLHTTDDIQESSFCTAHNLFSQLSSRQVTSETKLGSHYHPFSGSHAQHANESKALHLSIGAKTGHPRQMDGDGWRITSTGTRIYPQSGTLPSTEELLPLQLQSLGFTSESDYCWAMEVFVYIYSSFLSTLLYSGNAPPFIPYEHTLNPEADPSSHMWLDTMQS